MTYSLHTLNSPTASREADDRPGLGRFAQEIALVLGLLVLAFWWLALGRAEFARCLPENSSMAYAIMKGLVQRLRQADRRIESLALMDVYGRVARALLEFAQPDRDGQLAVRERISRQDIAKMVGASREMVSRVMKDLEERGFVETREDGSMVIREHLGALG